MLLKSAAERLERAGIERPVREAQLLLAMATGRTRLQALQGLDRPLTPEEAQRFEDLIARRERRVPFAYLRGTQEFYGLEFRVTPATLIPRPETEMLVDFAIERLRDLPGAMAAEAGTGTGCLTIAAALHLPGARFLATDLSIEALAAARENVSRYRLQGRVLLARADMLTTLADSSAHLILSNPPYIPTAEIADLQPEVRDYEPRMALDGGADGLSLYRSLARTARRALRPGGWIAVETGAGQALSVANLFHEAGLSSAEIRRDLAGIERLVAAQREM
jgi:release factor glutamine methyltransferase